MAEDMYFVAKLPKAISPKIAAFCHELDPTTKPQYVEVIPRQGAMELLCYVNCEIDIAMNGGKAQKGWMIWEYPGIYLCAEHHCVIERDGKLFCVTPQFDNSRRLLFLPSDIEHPSPIMGCPPARFKGLSDHVLVKQYIEYATKSSGLKADPTKINTPIQRQYEHIATMALFKFEEHRALQAKRKMLEQHRKERKAKKKQRS